MAWRVLISTPSRARLERDARAQRRFLEEHEQRPSLQRVPVVRRPGLHLERELEDAFDLLWGEAGDLGDMAQGGRHLAAPVSDGLCNAVMRTNGSFWCARPRIP